MSPFIFMLAVVNDIHSAEIKNFESSFLYLLSPNLAKLCTRRGDKYDYRVFELSSWCKFSPVPFTVFWAERSSRLPKSKIFPALFRDHSTRDFENNSKGLKDFPLSPPEGYYGRRIKQESTFGKSREVLSSSDIVWRLNVFGQRRVLRWPLTYKTVFNRKFQESQKEW